MIQHAGHRIEINKKLIMLLTSKTLSLFYEKAKARDLKDLNLLKHYRIIRKWACKNNGLNDADLELLIYFDCIDLFTIQDFKIGTYSYSWDNRRWNRLIQE